MTTTTEARAFDNVVKFRKKALQIQVKIKFDGERLSITGDIYEPTTYGTWRDVGGGQCYDELAAEFPKSARLVEIWKRWHLNDMRAGCEHQRNGGDAWNPSRELGFNKYKLKYEMLKKRDELKQRALADAQMDRSEKSSFNKRERELLKAPYTLEIPADETPNMALYELESSESKKSGWTRPDEHPGGILTKPCEKCGYKYGSAWLFEEVPAEILTELKEMK